MAHLVAGALAARLASRRSGEAQGKHFHSPFPVMVSPDVRDSRNDAARGAPFHEQGLIQPADHPGRWSGNAAG